MPDTTDGVHIPVWVRRSIILFWGTGVALVAIWVISVQLKSLLIQFVLALFLSFAMEPVVDRLVARGLRRGAAAALVLLSVIVAFVIFGVLMGSLVADQSSEIAEDLPGYLRSSQTWLEANLGVTVGTEEVITQIQDSNVANRLVSLGTAAAGVVFQLLTIMLLSYYLTADGPRFRRVICSLLPPHRQTEVIRVWELAINKTGAYISSRILLAFLSAAFHGIAFALIGLPSWVALALWVGLISQFIPAIGTYLAGILPVVAALGGNPRDAIWVIVVLLIYQQVENYVLQPRITQETLNLHPAVSIAAVLAGAGLFGAPGALLALPVVATGSGFVSAYVERHEVIETRLTGNRKPDPVV